MKHLYFLLLLLLVSSCGPFKSVDDKSLRDDFGIKVNPYKISSDSYYTCPLEALNQFISSNEHITGWFFLIGGGVKGDQGEMQTFDLLIRFPNGTRILKFPYKFVVINYDDVHPRVLITYRTLSQIADNLDYNYNHPIDKSIIVYVPRNSIYSDKAESELKYKSFK